MPYVFPTRLFNPGTMNARLVGAQQSGGRSLSGIVQNADLSGGGYWVVEFGDIALLSPDKVLAWRRLSAVLAGGATPVLVPLGDRRHQPLSPRKYGGIDTFGLSTWAEDDYWQPSDDTPDSIFAQGPILGWATRTTTIDFTYTGDVPLVGGEHFSLQNVPDLGIWRLHRIVRIIEHSGFSYTAEIRPPLRTEYASAGILMNFDSPRCLMRLDGDMEATLEQLRFGRGTVRFIEDFPSAAALGDDSPSDSP